VFQVVVEVSVDDNGMRRTMEQSMIHLFQNMGIGKI
jgi:hypothetical protein